MSVQTVKKSLQKCFISMWKHHMSVNWIQSSFQTGIVWVIKDLNFNVFYEVRTSVLNETDFVLKGTMHCGLFIGV